MQKNIYPRFKLFSYKSLLLVTAGIGFLIILNTVGANEKKTNAANPAKAALTVSVIKPQTKDWPVQLYANGSVAAWQEALIGSELGGLRLAAVNVNVGDTVQRGQILASFASETVAAELAQQQAALEEAQAALGQAQFNADKARTLAASGALSTQQILQYTTAEASAKAQVKSAQARVNTAQIRLRQTQVIAPDDGVISERLATVGAITQPGQELFKLIRKNRLEWRAEVTSSELSRIKPAQDVKLVLANGATVNGKVRIVAPTVNPQTRNAMVYVDLPLQSEARAGMFAKGSFELGRSPALALPQQAVVLRDGFSYVFVLQADNRVVQTKLSIGRRQADQVEVLAGLKTDQQVIASGAAFLADGDLVKVVTVPAAAGSAVNLRN